MDDIYLEFGKHFKKLREKNNLTQEQLAEHIGLEARQISRIETGKCFTTLDNLVKISKLYNTALKDIFDFEHKKSKEEIISTLNIMLNQATEDDCRKIYKITKELLY